VEYRCGEDQTKEMVSGQSVDSTLEDAPTLTVQFCDQLVRVDHGLILFRASRVRFAACPMGVEGEFNDIILMVTR
jgi:hypothetical protein